MSTTTVQITPSQVQTLQDEAIRIYRHRDQVWQDYKALPQEDQEGQNLLFRRVSEGLWDQYVEAWGKYLGAKEVLDREIGLKENKAKAEKVRSQTCMSCFEIKAANGTCGC